MDRLRSKGLAPFPALEEGRTFGGIRHGGQELLDHLVDGFVDGNSPGLSGLRLAGGKVIAGFQVPYLADRQAHEVDGAKVGVDADDEDRKIPRFVGEKLLDEPNVFEAADWFNGDHRAPLRMI